MKYKKGDTVFYNNEYFEIQDVVILYEVIKDNKKQYIRENIESDREVKSILTVEDQEKILSLILIRLIITRTKNTRAAARTTAAPK